MSHTAELPSTPTLDPSRVQTGAAQTKAAQAKAVVATGVRHVAIIMDGNGRWAEGQGAQRLKGHNAGADTVDEIVTEARTLGLEALTLYAFSTENWTRPQHEVTGLFALLERSIRRQGPRLDAHNIKFITIGDTNRLPSTLKGALDALKERTQDNTAMTLAVALNYGGRDEIVRAAQRLAVSVADGSIEPSQINEEMLGEHLDTAREGDLPDPELIIRTAGELRLSNFLLWQAAYAEFYSTNTYWPDFKASSLHDALIAFGGRRRRFGGLDSAAIDQD